MSPSSDSLAEKIDVLADEDNSTESSYLNEVESLTASLLQQIREFRRECEETIGELHRLELSLDASAKE